MYGVFGRKIIKYTVIYGEHIRFWPTLCIWHVYKQAVVFRACSMCTCLVYSMQHVYMFSVPNRISLFRLSIHYFSSVNE